MAGRAYFGGRDEAERPNHTVHCYVTINGEHPRVESLKARQKNYGLEIHRLELYIYVFPPAYSWKTLS